MKEVYEKVISKSNGWRMGSGPATCSGVIIDGTCYWIPKSYVSASQIDETCQAGMNGGQPAVSITSSITSSIRHRLLRNILITVFLRFWIRKINILWFPNWLKELLAFQIMMMKEKVHGQE